MNHDEAEAYREFKENAPWETYEQTAFLAGYRAAVKHQEIIRIHTAGDNP